MMKIQDKCPVCNSKDIHIEPPEADEEGKEYIDCNTCKKGTEI